MGMAKSRAGLTFQLRTLREKCFPFVRIVRNCCSHYFRRLRSWFSKSRRISKLISYLYGTKLALFLCECAPDC
jgi:hypothetical protein